MIDAVFGVGLNREVTEGSVFAAAIDADEPTAGGHDRVPPTLPAAWRRTPAEFWDGAVRADETVTFTFPKIGQAVGEGAVCSGTGVSCGTSVFRQT